MIVKKYNRFGRFFLTLRAGRIAVYYLDILEKLPCHVKVVNIFTGKAILTMTNGSKYFIYLKSNFYKNFMIYTLSKNLELVTIIIGTSSFNYAVVEEMAVNIIKGLEKHSKDTE